MRADLEQAGDGDSVAGDGQGWRGRGATSWAPATPLTPALRASGCLLTNTQVSARAASLQNGYDDLCEQKTGQFTTLQRVREEGTHALEQLVAAQAVLSTHGATCVYLVSSSARHAEHPDGLGWSPPPSQP